MVRQLGPVAMLLLGLFLLMFAGGMNGLLLPLRGSAEGFSDLALGLLGAGWAIGYILGCISTPRIVARVGHIRTFGVLAATAAIAILSTLLIVHPGAWPILRAVSGFAFAGAAMIVESWLSERADPAARGRIFGVYTMVNLGGTTAGQIMLMTGDPGGYVFFVLGAMVYCLALLPTALSTTAAPTPLAEVTIRPGALWRNSPIAFVGVLLIGVANSTFGTLGAVYAGQIGLSIATIALLMSAAILAGALFQIPVGFASDRMDRRFVLIALATGAIAVDATFILLQPDDPTLVLTLAALFGCCIYGMYPILLAHASDHAADSSFMELSGGLLVLFGIGSIFGPMIAGVVMSAAGPSGLFLTTICAHAIIVLFALWRISLRAAVPEDEKGAFVPVSVVRVSTPESGALDPRGEDEAESSALP